MKEHTYSLRAASVDEFAKEYRKGWLNSAMDIFARRDVDLGTAVIGADTLMGHFYNRFAPAADSVVRQTPVTKLELSRRALNALDLLNAQTLDDVARLTEIDLLRVRKCGQTTVNEIKRMLEKHGIAMERRRP